METNAIIIITALRFSLILILANTLAWFLTEFKGPIINVKPLNCRPCLTFWLVLAAGAAVYWRAGAAPLTYVFIVSLAFINYLYINSKTNIVK